MQDLQNQQVEAADGSRRRFVMVAAIAVAASSAAGMTWAALRAAMTRPRRRRRVHAGRIEDYAPGQWRQLRSAPVYVIATELGLAAVSSRCTHLGCTVRRVQDGYVCPCHGSRFDPEGRALSPPARHPLPWYQLSLINGRLLVDLEHTISTGTHLPWESSHA